MKARASIFDDTEPAGLDVSGFTPKTAAPPPPDQVKAIAEAASFPSRQVVKLAPALTVKPKREARRHRTGRTAQFNARATPETVDAFYTIADQQGWLMAETLARALGALQRELKEQGRGPGVGGRENFNA
jgi:hypothetical protein